MRQAAAGHGRACPRAPGWDRRDRRDRNPLARQGRSDQGWRRSLVPEQNARRRRGRSRRRRARPHSPRNKIQDFSAASLHGFVAANLAQGATIKTDGWAAYPGAPNVAHDPHVVGNMAAHIVLPWIHRVFSNLKTWALGVYHGLRRKHLQSYLDEFVFRFNRRRTRNAAFRSLLSIGLITKPITYEMLIRPEFAA